MQASALRAWVSFAFLVAVPLVGCRKPTSTTSGAEPPPSAPPSAASSAPVAPRIRAARSTGSALARAASGAALYLADEDAGSIRRVPLPLGADGGTELKLAGPPAQVIARGDEILVTVRDPGLVVVLADDATTGAMKEIATIKVAADAWGMALSPDEATLLVTSAWTHTVSIVDVAKREVVATLDVEREPRGVVFASDGKKAWVTHLVGTAVTRIELAGTSSKAVSVALPAGTARAPRGYEPSASLAYAPVLADDGTRLFVPRHALGAVSSPSGWGGDAAWWGTATVDILLLRDETPLVPKRTPGATVGLYGAAEGLPKTGPSAADGTLPATGPATFTQPRDAIWRPKTGSILVVSEGTDVVTEHDPLALAPALKAAVVYSIGGGYLADNKTKAPSAETGGAPQAIALSLDETEAYVWARGTRELIGFPLDPYPFGGGSGPRPPAKARTKAGPFPEPFTKDAASGRKLFYLAKDRVMSGGLGCAGCHPDGRDDGFVWHDARQKGDDSGGVVFVGHPSALFTPEDDGKPRQTPMLAGRVSSRGPYGWHAQNKDLEGRLIEGFGLHRWRSQSVPTAYEKAFRLAPLKAFLSEGLRPPPRDARPFTPEEERGRAVFESDETQCKSCHPSDSEYTTRAAMALKTPLPTAPGFAAEEDKAFKVPSLLFVGGTRPYYHDGSAKTLKDMIEQNGTRMGDTSHLSAADRAALVAFLGRL